MFNRLTLVVLRLRDRLTDFPQCLALGSVGGQHCIHDLTRLQALAQ